MIAALLLAVFPPGKVPEKISRLCFLSIGRSPYFVVLQLGSSESVCLQILLLLHSLHVGLCQRTVLKYESMNCLRKSFLALFFWFFIFDRFDLILLLLLAAPTWLWGRCGRHNSPPASSVMDLVFRRSDGSHVSADIFI